MRRDKATERTMDKLAAMLASSGKFNAVEVATLKEAAPTDKNAISRQGEAVLLFIESPAKFTQKQCKRCNEWFGTNYRSVGYCSDNCRARAMVALLGVRWDYWKPEEERWGGEPPLVIPPAALAKLKEFVDFFAIPQNQEASRVLQDQSPLDQLDESQIEIVQNTLLVPEETDQTSLPLSLPELTLEEFDLELDLFD